MTRSDNNQQKPPRAPERASVPRERACDPVPLIPFGHRKVSRSRWLRAVKRIRELSSDVSRLRREREALRRLAFRDPLTGLYNRRGFDDHLSFALGKLRRAEDALAVILLDVDDLKRINDSRGHAAGDAALRTVAEALRRAVRVGDHVARLGGDEFAVLLPATDEEQARTIALRVREVLQGASSAAGHRVTVSAGVAQVTGADFAPGQADRLLLRADRALYVAKRSGRNRIDTASLCACKG